MVDPALNASIHIGKRDRSFRILLGQPFQLALKMNAFPFFQFAPVWEYSKTQEGDAFRHRLWLRRFMDDKTELCQVLDQ